MLIFLILFYRLNKRIILHYDDVINIQDKVYQVIQFFTHAYEESMRVFLLAQDFIKHKNAVKISTKDSVLNLQIYYDTTD
jgi:hypothetical protein